MTQTALGHARKAVLWTAGSNSSVAFVLGPAGGVRRLTPLLHVRIGILRPRSSQSGPTTRITHGGSLSITYCTPHLSEACFGASPRSLARPAVTALVDTQWGMERSRRESMVVGFLQLSSRSRLRIAGNHSPGGHTFLLMNATGLNGIRGIKDLTIVEGHHVTEGYKWTEVTVPSSPIIPPLIEGPMTVSCARMVASRPAKGHRGLGSSAIQMTLSTGFASIKSPLTLALES